MTSHLITAELHEPSRGRIVTEYRSIVTERYSWCAWRDGDDPSDESDKRLGYGYTKSEAIADLKRLERGE